MSNIFQYLFIWPKDRPIFDEYKEFFCVFFRNSAGRYHFRVAALKAVVDVTCQ